MSHSSPLTNAAKAAADTAGIALRGLDAIRADLADLYRDLHAHPELSFAEHRTAAEVADRARALGYEVTTGVGRTGVVAVLRNGRGPPCCCGPTWTRCRSGSRPACRLRGSDRRRPVMHACGHDMHVTCLLGALDLLAGARSTVVGHRAGRVPAGRGDRRRRARPWSTTACTSGSARPTSCSASTSRPIPAGWLGAHPGPAFAATDALDVSAVRQGRARFAARDHRRPGGDGGVDRAAAADHRVPRDRRRRTRPWSPSARCTPGPRTTSSRTRPT